MTRRKIDTNLILELGTLGGQCRALEGQRLSKSAKTIAGEIRQTSERIAKRLGVEDLFDDGTEADDDGEA